MTISDRRSDIRLKFVAQPESDKIRTRGDVVYKAEDAGPVVDSDKQVPLWLPRQGKGQFDQNIIQQMRGFMFISLPDLEFGLGGRIGQAIAKSEAGVQEFIPEKWKPAQRESAIQLLMILFSRVPGGLTLQLVTDEVFVFSKFFAQRDHVNVRAFEIRIQPDDFIQRRIGILTRIKADEPHLGSPRWCAG
jgi:hypothetical protein